MLRVLGVCRAFLSIFFVLLLGVMTGCAPIAFIPDQVGDSGLVLAEFQSTMPGVRDVYNPVIDGTRYQYGIRDGVLIMSLAPGTHTLNGLIAGGESGSAVTPFGTFTRYSYSRLPLDLKFETRAGEATYLGTIFLLEQKADTGLYTATALDDSQAFEKIMRERHPKLLDSLKTKPFDIYPTRITSADAEIYKHGVAARKAIDLYASLMSNGQTPKENTYVTGPLGTVGLVQNPSPRPRVMVLSTSMLADLSQCVPASRRFACAIDSSRYLVVNGLGTERRDVPEGVELDSAYTYGSQGLLLVDRSGVLYASGDNGNTWHQYDGLREEPLPVGSMNDYMFRQTDNGLYVYLGGPVYTGLAHHRTPRLAFVDYRDMTFHDLALPKNASWVKDVHETPRGLYVGPVIAGAFENDRLLVKQPGEQDFETRVLPSEGCGRLLLEDEDNAETAMRIECYDKKFRSTDGGRSWMRLPVS